MQNSVVKPTLVFLPGMLCDERVWAPQIEVLRANYEIIFVDLKPYDSIEGMVEAVNIAVSGERDGDRPRRRTRSGAGVRSGRGTNSGAGRADSVSKVGAATATKFILAGFSMGGYIAQEYALRFRENLSRLILVGVSGRGFTEEEREKHRWGKRLAEQSRFAGIPDQRLKEYLHPQSYEDVALRELIKDMAKTDASQVYLRQLKATQERRDLRAELVQVSCPVLVIGGAEDQIAPIEWMEELAGRFEDSRFVKIEESGHFVSLEKSAKVSEAIWAFLRE
ncbi:MAG: alpha/beta hydrolase [Bdellovibrionota bacterium]